MFTLISLIVVAIGVANWFSIGAFQYDFIAGLFGSQANIFSRLIYVIVGIAGIFLAYSVIRNKGKLIFKNKNDKELFNFGKKAKVNAESGNDSTPNSNSENNINNNDNKSESAYDANLKRESDDHTVEASYDTSKQSSNLNIQQRANRINDKNKLSGKTFHTESARENSIQNKNNNKYN